MEFVVKENIKLAQEIQQIEDNRVVQDIQKIVRKKYEIFKTDNAHLDALTGSNAKTNAQLRSFPAYLWARGGKELFKRFTLAEAYREVAGSSFTELDEQGSLYKAMVLSFKNKEEFPTDELKFSKDGWDQFMEHSRCYKRLYIDAFTATRQCEILSKIRDPQDPLEEVAEKAVFTCYYSWAKNGKSFEPPQNSLG